MYKFYICAVVGVIIEENIKFNPTHVYLVPYTALALKQLQQFVSPQLGAELLKFCFTILIKLKFFFFTISIFFAR